MKTWHWVALYSIALLVIGGFIGYNFVNRNKPTTDTGFTKPDTVEIHTVVPCSVGYPVPFKVKDTVIVYRGDTVEAIKTSFLDSTYTWVDNRRLWQDFDMRILSKDSIFGYVMFFKPRQYKWMEIPKKPLEFYGSGTVSISLNNKKTLFSEAEVGMIFKERVSLFGRISIDNEDENILDIKPMIGVRLFL